MLLMYPIMASNVARKMADKEATGMDALALVEHTMAVEAEFGIEMPDEKVDSVVTFGDLIKVIGENLAKV